MAYIGRENNGFGVRSRFIYTATGGQTTFNTDDSGNALSYADSAYVDVYLNGVLLDPADYTATSLTSIVLDSGATASDILEVIVYDVFSVFSGTFTNGITANTATVTGDVTVDTNTLFVDASENTIFVGKTSTDFDGGVFEAGPGGTFVSRSGSPFNVNRNDSDGKLVGFSKDGTEVGVINAKSDDLNIGTGDTGLRFNDNLNAIQPFNTSTNAAINDTINLGSSGAKFNEAYINGGVYINGTSSDDLLDDYEEGTWTPTFEAGSATVANALYIRIGRFVQVAAVISSFTDRTSTANLDISGLPFASASNNKTSQSIMCRFINAGGDSVAAYIANSVSKIQFYGISQGAGYARVNHNELNNSTANLFITATYRCVA